MAERCTGGVLCAGRVCGAGAAIRIGGVILGAVAGVVKRAEQRGGTRKVQRGWTSGTIAGAGRWALVTWT